MGVPKGTVRLKRPQDVRRLLSRVINEMITEDPISVERARVIATLSNSIIKAMELGELEERMRKIEEQLGETK